MNILLDTHVWVWYINGSEELNKSIRKTITSALYHNELAFSAISIWEICMLNKKQRIILEMPCLEWINKFIDLTRIRILPITPSISVESCDLPGSFHSDPADCLIVATARVEGLTLITRDKRILNYGKHKYISVVKA